MTTSATGWQPFSGRPKSARLTRLSGGASRETWRFEADGVPLILQRQRAGDVRDMAVEIAARPRRRMRQALPTADDRDRIDRLRSSSARRT